MSLDATTVDSGSGGARAPKARLLTLGDLDRRTGAYRRTVDLIERVEADLGGSDQLSTAEQQLVRHAAMTSAMIEDLATRWLGGEPIDPALFATLTNSERRLFEATGLKRKPRDVLTLERYLADRATAAPAEPAHAVSAPAATSDAPTASSDDPEPAHEEGEA